MSDQNKQKYRDTKNIFLKMKERQRWVFYIEKLVLALEKATAAGTRNFEK